MRVVVDTNVILGGLKKPQSPDGKIVELCLSGDIQPVGSPKTKAEAKNIVQRMGLGKEAWIRLDKLMYKTIEVEPTTKFDISTDRSDNLHFEAAYANGAKIIITNDHHILEHDGYWGIRVMRPHAFLKTFEKADGPSSQLDFA
jgi:putative PIN family toxin of toxin-antitoxin system